MWADNETDQDLLGFSIHAELLQAIITDPKMLPVTVGLFGDWGGGKSSILKIIKSSLDQNEDVAVIYFNSWVFEGYEDAKSAILTTLLKGLRDHRKLKDIIGDEAQTLIKRVKVMELLKIGVSAAASYFTANPIPLLMTGGKLLADATDGGDEKETTEEKKELPELSELLKDSKDANENVRSFRKDFQKLIKKTNLKSVIILVDDLDRCSPERLIQNLEAIKLFLNVERTAFIVATDRRIVENAIRIRYSELFTGEKGAAAGDALVTDYLEKLIQVPYQLPKLAPHEVRSYLCMLFLKKHLCEESFKEVLRKYVQFVKKDRYAAFQLGHELQFIQDATTRTVVAESMRLVEACSEAITDGLKGNPRQIKRFLNAFWLRKELARIAQISHLKEHILIKLMVLEYISDERFEELYQWHRGSNDGTAVQLGELEVLEDAEAIPERFSNWGTMRLWRWIKAEPRLVNEDLRDYFWVSRSAVTDTLTGVRLMTQSMRICVEDLISKVERERTNGVAMFSSLSEDEQVGVLGMVTRHAMQDSKDDSALRSLLNLASNNHLNSAEALAKCIGRITAAKLSPGFGITLRAFKVESGNRASELVGELRDRLSKLDTPVGRALKGKKKEI